MSQLIVADALARAGMSQAPEQPEVDNEAIFWILICATHNARFRESAMQLISPAHLHKPHEIGMRLLWDAIITTSSQYEGITYENISFVVRQLLQQPIYQGIDPATIASLYAYPGGIIADLTIDPPDLSPPNIRLATDLVTRLFRERAIVGPLRNVSTATLDTAVLNAASQLQRAAASTANPMEVMFPDPGTAVDQGAVLTPSNTSYIDNVLGGLQQGDIFGLLGSTGSGKSTLAINMTVNAAKAYWTQNQLDNSRRFSGYFTYEEPYVRLRDRFWSHACNIPRVACLQFNDWSQLSTLETLKPYELEMYRDTTEPIPEIDRYRQVLPALQNHLNIFDMSGSERHPDSGRGHIPEMVGLLQRYQEESGCTPGFLVIDWVGDVCRRHLRSRNGNDEDSYRRALAEFAGQARVEIAQQFNCTVMLVHQLKGALKSASPRQLFNANEAEGTADFSVQMTTCLTLSNPHAETRCRYLHFAKTRFLAGNVEPSPVVLQLHPLFATYTDVTSAYTYNDALKGFESRSQAGAIQGLDLAPSAGPPGILNNNIPRVGPPSISGNSDAVSPSDAGDFSAAAALPTAEPRHSRALDVASDADDDATDAPGDLGTFDVNDYD